MIKVLFICHGNICRSPMAQFVFQHMLDMAGLTQLVDVDSAATSREEIGNPPHRGTIKKLRKEGVPVLTHFARQMTKTDFELADYVIGMDDANIKNLLRMVGGDPAHKIYKLLSFAGSDRDIADPWYTGDFDQTYEDVTLGCQALLSFIQKRLSEYDPNEWVSRPKRS